MELSPAAADGEGFQLRPFSLPAGERTYQFLTGWISRLLAHRRMELERVRSERDPRPRGRPLRFRASGADPWNAGPLLALKDVARAGPLAR